MSIVTNQNSIIISISIILLYYSIINSANSLMNINTKVENLKVIKCIPIDVEPL